MGPPVQQAPSGGPRTLCSPIQAVPVVIGCLEAQDGEDGSGGVEGGHAVDQGDDHCVLFTVVPEQT